VSRYAGVTGCGAKAEALDSVRELAGTMIEAAQALSIIASDR
jgi:hypothetical protein